MLPNGVNMKARTKFLVGGLLVLGPVGYLMASSIRQTGVYYLTPTELSTKLATDSTFRDVGVKVGARVVPGSIQRDPERQLADENQARLPPAAPAL